MIEGVSHTLGVILLHSENRKRMEVETQAEEGAMSIELPGHHILFFR